MAWKTPNRRELDDFPQSPWYFRRWFIILAAVLLGLSAYIAVEMYEESQYQKRIQQGGFGPAHRD
jgi:hypothetical protein